MRRFATGLVTVLLSTILSLVALEVAVRAATGTLSERRNYATDPVNLVKASRGLDFDSQLGWMLKKDQADFGFGPWRNRLHKAAPNASGAPILAVGDSFTYGSEVEADETWPARLEAETNIPVINGGVGGYGVDQMVLWAERLVPDVKPRLIILSFIPNDVVRTRMSIFSGASKPFFRVVDGKLVGQNLPLEPYVASLEYAQAKAILGYSKLADWVAERLGLTNMWRLGNFEIRYEQADDIAISCAFMTRLAAIGVPTIVVGQYGWSEFTPAGKSSVDQGAAVLDCARKTGMTVVDTWQSLKAMLPDEFGPAYRKYFMNGKGHMTPEGNALVAKLIMDALGPVRSAGQR